MHKRLQRKVLTTTIFILASITGFGLLHGEKAAGFPVLKGPYLGQKPPGMEPEIFAPGIISRDKYEMCSVFSPQGDEFFYSISDRKAKRYKILFTRIENGVWTRPKLAPFSLQYSNVDMAYSPDGRRLYFCSQRPAPWNTPEIKAPVNMDIWYVERTQSGWSEPINPGLILNSIGGETYPTFTRDGTMYFASNRKGSLGSKDIYYSKYVSGKFTRPVHLGKAINSKWGEGDTYVAPDESYLIVNSWERPTCLGSGDLFISFRKKDGSWTDLKNMGNVINTEVLEFCPMVSPDGKYLFFTRNGDIYWVDIKIIEQFRPK